VPDVYIAQMVKILHKTTCKLLALLLAFTLVLGVLAGPALAAPGDPCHFNVRVDTALDDPLPHGSFAVTADGAPVTLDTAQDGLYAGAAEGMVISVTAIPDPGYAFTGWSTVDGTMDSGGQMQITRDSTANPAVFTLYSATTLGGSFQPAAAVNAQQPVITGQPQDAAVNIAQPGGTYSLSVTADPPGDGGQLSYQWYSVQHNSDGSAAGNSISGATGPQYAAPTDVPGVYYYAVDVTNTIPDNGDGGVKAATKTSREATVTVYNIGHLFSVSVSPSGAGTISATANGSPISFPGPGPGDGGVITSGPLIPAGMSISVTATANPGYVFSGWNAGGVSLPDPAAATVTFAMPAAPCSLTANFAAATNTNQYQMLRDNYQFANTWSSFGYSSNYRIPLARYQQLYSAADSSYLYNALGTWGGSCYGFSSTDLSFFGGDLNLNTYQNGAGNVYALNAPGSPSHSLTQLMELFQVSQFAAVLSNQLNGSNKNNGAGLVQAVQSFQAGDKSAGVVLGVFSPGVGGHAIVPYAVTQTGANQYDISVYDNNWPADASRKMHLNTATGAWSYELWPGLVFGPAGGDYFGFVKYKDVFNLVHRVTGIGNSVPGAGKMSVIAPRDAQVQDTGGAGIGNIPGAYEDIPMSLVQGATQPPDRIYVLPAGQYAVSPGGTGANAATFFDDNLGLTAISGNQAALITGGLGSGGNSINIASQGQNDFTIVYTNNSASNPITLTGRADGDISASVSGSGLLVTGASTFTASNGSQNKTYNLSNGQTMLVDFSTPGPTGGGGGGGGGSSGASISPTAVNFDQKTGGDVIITLAAGGHTLNGVKNGGYTLAKGTDYTVSGNKVTIQASYLTTLAVGKQTLTFNMSGGTNPVLTVTIAGNTQVNPAPVTPAPVQPLQPVSPEPWQNPFTDVNSNDWFYSSVAYVSSHSLMVGAGTEPMLFSPHMSTSRGMVVTILYRAAGSPDVSGLANPFSDVPSGQWYTDAVRWAAANGIVAGYSASQFGPGDKITREQLAAILYRYADFANISLPALGNYPGFTDDTKIAGYAKEAINALVVAGIISGYPDGSIRPQGTATRAEVAAMLSKFMALENKG